MNRIGSDRATLATCTTSGCVSFSLFPSPPPASALLPLIAFLIWQVEPPSEVEANAWDDELEDFESEEEDDPFKAALLGL